ncbi:MAG: hypothetical protein AAFQ41_01200 [Cyanobacteria bacterium J06623_7]
MVLSSVNSFIQSLWLYQVKISDNRLFWSNTGFNPSQAHASDLLD